MTHFEILYGVYGVKAARKFVVLSVWVRVPVNTPMLRSSNWLGHSPFTGELTGSSPVRSTTHTSHSVKATMSAVSV